MTQGVLSFKYEEEKKDFGSTSTAGLLLFLDLLYKMDFIKIVNRHLDAKVDRQGWSDFYFLLCLILLNIRGGDCVDDVKVMEKDDGFGRIEFAICCDIYDSFKKAVYEVKEEDWKKIYKEVNENGKLKLKWTGQEWAEVCYVPENIGRSKNDPDYRYIAIRELVKQKELVGIVDEEELQKSFSFPNVKINKNRYKISGIVTNLCWDGEKIIHWQRQRCGYSEHVHSEMKEAFCGGSLPSGKFGSNAAWWWIMLLSLNLTVLLKSLVLDKNWKTSRMKRIRYWLINVPGRVILKGKDLVVRLTRGHPAFGLLVDARRRIAALGLDVFDDMDLAPG